MFWLQKWEYYIDFTYNWTKYRLKWKQIINLSDDISNTVSWWSSSPYENASTKDIDWDWVPDFVFYNTNPDWTKKLTINVNDNWSLKNAITLDWIKSITYKDLNWDWVKDIIAKLSNWNVTVRIFDKATKTYKDVLDVKWDTIIIDKDINWDWKIDFWVKNWTNFDIYLNEWIAPAKKIWTLTNIDSFDTIQLRRWYSDILAIKKLWSNNGVNYYRYNIYLYNNWKLVESSPDMVWKRYQLVDLNANWMKDFISDMWNSKLIYVYNSKTKKYQYLDTVKDFTPDYVRYYWNTPVFDKSYKWYITFINIKWELRYMNYSTTYWKYLPAQQWIIETNWQTKVQSKPLKDVMNSLRINFNWKTFSSMKLREINIENNWTWYDKVLALQADPNTVIVIKPANKFDDTNADYIVINKNKVWFTPNVDKLRVTALKKDNIFSWLDDEWSKWLLALYFWDSHYIIYATNPSTFQGPVKFDLSKVKEYSKVINWVTFKYWSYDKDWYILPYNPNTLENKIKDVLYFKSYSSLINHKYKLTKNPLDLDFWIVSEYILEKKW